MKSAVHDDIGVDEVARRSAVGSEGHLRERETGCHTPVGGVAA